MYPKFAIIDDNDYAHAILACSTDSAQDDVLKRFLESKTRSVIQEYAKKCYYPVTLAERV